MEIDEFSSFEQLPENALIVRYIKFDDIKHIFGSGTIRLNEASYYRAHELGLRNDNNEFNLSIYILKTKTGAYSTSLSRDIESPSMTCSQKIIQYGFGHQFISCWSVPYYGLDDAHALMTFLGYFSDKNRFEKPMDEHRSWAVLLVSTVGQVFNLINSGKKQLPHPYEWSIDHRTCCYYKDFYHESEFEYINNFDKRSNVVGGFLKNEQYAKQREYRFICYSNLYDVTIQRKQLSSEVYEYKHVDISAEPNAYINKCYINPKMLSEDQEEARNFIRAVFPEKNIISYSSDKPIII